MRENENNHIECMCDTCNDLNLFMYVNIKIIMKLHFVKKKILFIQNYP